MSDQDLLNTIKTLTSSEAREPLKTPDPRGARVGGKVRVDYVPPTRGGGGGLVSPIEEVSRTYHTERVVWSADGLIPLLLRRTNVLIMRDAEGAEEERRFADAP